MLRPMSPSPTIISSWLLLFAWLVSQCATTLEAQEWSRFRGPNGSGVLDVDNLPSKFDADHQVWRREVPFAHASAVLAPERVFVTAADPEQLIVICLARSDGELLWRWQMDRPRNTPRFKRSCAASPTPVTDGENLYAFFQEFGLVSLDSSGKERWTHPLGPFRNHYGMASSPVLARDTVLLLCDQEADSFLVAVDKANGKERWKRMRKGLVESHTTPVLYPSAADPRQVITFGSLAAHGYDLKTGAPVWHQLKLGAGSVCSPVIVGNRIFVCAPDHSDPAIPVFTVIAPVLDKDRDGKLTKPEFGDTVFAEHFEWVDRNDDGFIDEKEWQGSLSAMACKDYGLVAFDLDTSEAGVEARIKWRHREDLAALSTPLVYRGVVYMVKDGGILTSLDPASGAVLKCEELPDADGEYFSSPVAGDGKIYMANNAGVLLVLEAAGEWRVISKRDFGEEISATPALGSDGSVFVRTESALYCFRKTK